MSSIEIFWSREPLHGCRATLTLILICPVLPLLRTKRKLKFNFFFSKEKAMNPNLKNIDMGLMKVHTFAFIYA
jgi:hypothetical protein